MKVLLQLIKYFILFFNPMGDCFMLHCDRDCDIEMNEYKTSYFVYVSYFDDHWTLVNVRVIIKIVDFIGIPFHVAFSCVWILYTYFGILFVKRFHLVAKSIYWNTLLTHRHERSTIMCKMSITRGFLYRKTSAQPKWWSNLLHYPCF